MQNLNNNYRRCELLFGHVNRIWVATSTPDTMLEVSFNGILHRTFKVQEKNIGKME